MSAPRPVRFELTEIAPASPPTPKGVRAAFVRGQQTLMGLPFNLRPAVELSRHPESWILALRNDPLALRNDPGDSFMKSKLVITALVIGAMAGTTFAADAKSH